MGGTVQVYALIAPPMYPEPRYIGVTKRVPQRRLQNHLSAARRGEKTHKARWIRRCDRLGLEVQIVVIDVVPTEVWEEAERAWISRLPNLTNGCAGGGGVLSPPPETRAKMSTNAKARCTPEWREQFSKSKLGRSWGQHTPEWREQAAERSRGIRHSPETRAKLSAIAKSRCTPEHVAYLRQLNADRGPVSADTRAKMSAVHKERWARKRAVLTNG